MNTIPEFFGSLVFDDRVMKARLPYERVQLAEARPSTRARSLDS